MTTPGSTPPPTSGGADGGVPAVPAPGLLETMWRARVLIIAACAIAGAAGYLITAQEPATYAATARLALEEPISVAVGVAEGDPDRHVQNERQRAASRAVLDVAARRLGGDVTAAGLSRRVDVDAGEGVDLLVITATSRSPEDAAAVADQVAIAYQEVAGADRERALARSLAVLAEQRRGLEERLADAGAQLVANPTSPAALTTLDIVSRQITAIEERAAQLGVAVATSGSGVEAYEAPVVPSDPVAPDPLGSAIALVLLALVTTSAYSWWWAGRQPTARDRQAPAAVLDAPLLAEVPGVPRTRRAASMNPRRLFTEAPEVAEAYLMAAAATAARLPAGQRVIAVTSPQHGTGSTTVAASLAAAAAHDRDVALVDVAHRSRGATALLAARTAEVTAGAGGPPASSSTRRIGILDGTAMAFIPSAPDAGPASAAREAVHADLDRARQRFDLTVVDTDAVLEVAHTSTILPLVDAVVLVVRTGTPLETLAKARRRLDVLGSPLLGYVFVDAARGRWAPRRPRAPRRPLLGWRR